MSDFKTSIIQQLQALPWADTATASHAANLFVSQFEAICPPSTTYKAEQYINMLYEQLFGAAIDLQEWFHNEHIVSFAFWTEVHTLFISKDMNPLWREVGEHLLRCVMVQAKEDEGDTAAVATLLKELNHFAAESDRMNLSINPNVSEVCVAILRLSLAVTLSELRINLYSDSQRTVIVEGCHTCCQSRTVRESAPELVAKLGKFI